MNYDRLRLECGLLDLTGVALVAMTGEDRKEWLQGQVTNDVRPLAPGGSVSFCFCTATGQIQAVADAWALEDRIVMTTARESQAAVLRRAEEMVVMEDVIAEDAGISYHALSIQGPTATERLQEIVPLPSGDSGESQVDGVTVLCLRSDRTGFGGWDLWVPRTAEEVIRKIELAFEPITQGTYDIARLEAGIPFFGSDIQAKTMPPELGPQFESRHVSYKKGCYMGQEVLMRIHSRGHTNKTWVGLVAEAPLEIGAEVHHAARGNVGSITSVALSPVYGPIGAATVRNEVANPGELLRVLTERGEVEAEVRIMPIR